MPGQKDFDALCSAVEPLKIAERQPWRVQNASLRQGQIETPLGLQDASMPTLTWSLLQIACQQDCCTIRMTSLHRMPIQPIWDVPIAVKAILQGPEIASVTRCLDSNRQVARGLIIACSDSRASCGAAVHHNGRAPGDSLLPAEGILEGDGDWPCHDGHAEQSDALQGTSLPEHDCRLDSRSICRDDKQPYSATRKDSVAFTGLIWVSRDTQGCYRQPGLSHALQEEPVCI